MRAVPGAGGGGVTAPSSRWFGRDDVGELIVLSRQPADAGPLDLPNQFRLFLHQPSRDQASEEFWSLVGERLHASRAMKCVEFVVRKTLVVLNVESRP